MEDKDALAPIGSVVRETRKRLRIQGALDGLALAIGPAFPFGLAAYALGRPDLAALVGGTVVAVALASALRRHPDVAVAARLDRAGNLADRIGTAIALANARADDPVAAALVDAAVRDGVAAAKRTSAKQAVPYRWPDGTYVAFGIIGVTAALALVMPARTADERDHRSEAVSFDADDPFPPYDVGFAHHEVGALRDHHPETTAIACRLDDDLDRLAAGSIDKEVMLLEVDKAMRELEHAHANPSLLEDVEETIRRLDSHPPPPPHVKQAPGTPSPPVGDEPGWDRTNHVDLPRTMPSTLPTRDVDLQGDRAPSRREVISAAAQQGFASLPYQKLYTDYQRLVEDTMHVEAMPSSYRYVVKRYFYAIRPDVSCRD